MIETRSLSGLEVQGSTLVGYGIVFNSPSEIIHEDGRRFREIITPEAVTDALAPGKDIRALIEHDSTRVIGRTKSGTLRYRVDAHGVRVEIDVPESQTALIESVRRGDIDGMSFGFSVDRSAIDWSYAGSIVTRTIRKIAKISEFSIVAVPAFQEATVAFRSLDTLADEQRSTELMRLRLNLTEII